MPALARVKAPAGLVVRRARSKRRSVVISWSSAKHAIGYGVTAQLSGGRDVVRSRSARCRRVVLKHVGSTASLRVKVFGLRKDGAPGRAITAKLQRRAPPRSGSGSASAAAEPR